MSRIGNKRDMIGKDWNGNFSGLPHRIRQFNVEASHATSLTLVIDC